jgi:hypothetical protein
VQAALTEFLICSINLDGGGTLKLSARALRVIRPRHEPERADVSLHGEDPSCCYFAYARDSITVDPTQPVSRVPFFRGAGARRGLLIEPVGGLFLRFRLLRDKI